MQDNRTDIIQIIQEIAVASHQVAAVLRPQLIRLWDELRPRLIQVRDELRPRLIQVREFLLQLEQALAQATRLLVASASSL
jgi:hypothetical protein